MANSSFFRDFGSKRRAADDARAILPPGALDPERAGHTFRLSRGEPFARALERAFSPGKPMDDIVLEAQIGVSNFLPSVFLEIGATRAKAVAILKIEQGTDWDGKFGSWAGTGFLVGPGLLLTNHHVINSVEVARDTVVQFGYRVGVDNKLQAPTSFRLLPDELFLTSPLRDGLDYTFVAIDQAAAAAFGYVKLDRRYMAAGRGTPANIIQHPDGRPQEIVIQQNEIEADEGATLLYVSDTEGGSSGAPVFDNNWDLIALHHAAKKTQRSRGSKPAAGPSSVDGQVRNEGIKISAIAADLERLSSIGEEAANQVLVHIGNIDSGLGLFGALGRRTDGGEKLGPERVVSLYQGTDRDLDIGFWNIEWFSNRYQSKVKDVASAIADFSLDIWGLSESSPAAVEALLEELRERYGLHYEAAHSEPGAGTGKQSTSVIWNSKVVRGQRVEWPESIAHWFTVDSRDFDDLDLEVVHGKVFDRYPGLFRFEPVNHKLASPFLLVPVHLKAKSEGSLRRSQATRILAAAIKRMKDDGEKAPWIVGGDFNAEIASGDFNALADGGLRALTAGDEKDGAFTYIESPYRSLIDHVYVTADLTPRLDPDEVFIVAADKHIPDYVKRLSDHRPVVVRLVATDEAPKQRKDRRAAARGLSAALSDLYGKRRKKAQEPDRTADTPEGSGPREPSSTRVTLADFAKMLGDSATTEADLKPYVRLDRERSSPFRPIVTIDPGRVEIPPRPELEPESAHVLELLNSWCRARRLSRYRRRIKDGYSGPRFVSEGDSWFQYPILLEDVIDNLLKPYAIFSLDAGGDTLANMVATQEYLRALRDERPDALLLSAGGNDLLGEVDGVRRLKTILAPFDAAKAPGDYPNMRFYVLLKEVMDGYVDIFKKVRALPSPIPIFVHCYDYAAPGEGGPWLKQPMEELGIHDPQLQRAIIRVLINKFAEALSDVAAGTAGVVFVDTRNTVGQAPEWHDELHPKEPGFSRVSAKFVEAIRKKFP